MQQNRDSSHIFNTRDYRGIPAGEKWDSQKERHPKERNSDKRTLHSPTIPCALFTYQYLPISLVYTRTKIILRLRLFSIYQLSQISVFLQVTKCDVQTTNEIFSSRGTHILCSDIKWKEVWPAWRPTPGINISKTYQFYYLSFTEREISSIKLQSKEYKSQKRMRRQRFLFTLIWTKV